MALSGERKRVRWSAGLGTRRGGDRWGGNCKHATSGVWIGAIPRVVEPRSDAEERDVGREKDGVGNDLTNPGADEVEAVTFGHDRPSGEDTAIESDFPCLVSGRCWPGEAVRREREVI